MSDRQLIWKCSNCGDKQEENAGENHDRECVACGVEGKKYIVHDENIGYTVTTHNGKLQKENQEHKRSGERVHPENTTGV